MTTKSSYSATVAASAVGTLFEWYDFLIFATAAALVFGKLFFAATDPVAVTMAAMLTFAVGYFARPLGAVIFGHLGDRWGRRPALGVTMAVMGISTFAIGLLPTYDQIGTAAAVLLVVLRILQGMAFGGEWGGACLMITEQTQSKRPAFATSLIQTGYPAGLLLAAGSFALLNGLSEADFLAWGWRVPFLASIVLTLVGAYVRWRLMETPAWQAAQTQQVLCAQPIRLVLRDHWRTLAQGVALKVTEVTWAYLLTVYFVMYAVTNMGMTRPEVMSSVLLASAINLVAIPAMGWLADRLGYRSMYLWGALLSMVIAIPVWSMLSAGNIAVAMVMGLLLGNAVMMAPLGACLSSLFPAEVRYTGVSLSNQIAAAVGGGVMPLAAAALVTSFGNLAAVAAAMIVLSLFTAVAAHKLAP